jgi:hypothetical protein
MCILERKVHASSADWTISDLSKRAETGSAQIEKEGAIALLPLVNVIVFGLIFAYWSATFSSRLCSSCFFWSCNFGIGLVSWFLDIFPSSYTNITTNIPMRNGKTDDIALLGIPFIFGKISGT